MGSHKYAGPDGFKPIVMKNFGPIALGCITNLFQAIYSTGYIPIEFRKSKVVFVPKPLKDDYGEAGSFRPMGTDTALSTLVNLIESEILMKQLCLVVSVDIHGAFDNLAFMAIENVMGDNNYPPYMIRWYMNLKKKKKKKKKKKQDCNC